MTLLDTPLADLTQVEQAIRAALTVRPCHITGLHTPDHHLRYSCTDMKADTLVRVLDALGLTYDELPKELHPDDGWCHDIPGQEEYRERQRQTYRWAGVDIPPELAAPAVDALRFGDADLVLAVITTEWQPWGTVREKVVCPEPPEMVPERFQRAVAVLKDAGAIEIQADFSTGYTSVIRRVPSDREI